MENYTSTYGTDYGSDFTNLSNLSNLAMDSAVLGVISVIIMIASVVALIILVLSAIAMWKVFVKANKPGWAAIVPVYNLVVLLQIAGMQSWMVVLYLIPGINLVIMVLSFVKIAQNFGKSGLFACGLIFFAPIFWLILAFGNSQYQPR